MNPRDALPYLPRAGRPVWSTGCRPRQLKVLSTIRSDDGPVYHTHAASILVTLVKLTRYDDRHPVV